MLSSPRSGVTYNGLGRLVVRRTDRIHRRSVYSRQDYGDTVMAKHERLETEVVNSYAVEIAPQRANVDTIQQVAQEAVNMATGRNELKVSVQQISDDCVEVTVYRQWKVTRYTDADGNEISSEEHFEMWSQRVNDIQEQVDDAIFKRYDGRKSIVSYSMYEDDDTGLPIDNLSKIPFKGEYQIYYDGGWGDVYNGPVLKDPTHLDLAVEADNAIRASGDEHHIFLEAAQVAQDSEPGRPGIISLIFGS